ncbi:uncharacterized protein LOC131891347 isoform X2 [Tigriopus californicus]|nr:uncharacterized protein LOC131891347 isoform X2 [Tigriopus californicus]
MMIATTCFVVTLLIFIQGQVGNSHVATFRQATDSIKSDTSRISVGAMKYRLEFEEGSGIMETMLNVEECPGTGFPRFTISLPNPTGCYVFQTTGFNMEGYPNNTRPSSSSHLCGYTIQFEAIVSGTVTVKEKDFQFQGPNSCGNCVDYVYISGVNDQQQQNDGSDSDDQNSSTDGIEYCGTIQGDKIRDFSDSSLFIEFGADNTVNGNGAEIVICIT